MDTPNNLLDDTPKLVLSPAVYDKLKLTVQILLPAISTLYFTLGGIWGFPEVEKVIGTIAAITVALGAVVAVSAKRYLNSDLRFDGVVVPQVDGGGLKAASMELKGDPEVMLQNQEELRFKVLPPTAAPPKV